MNWGGRQDQTQASTAMIPAILGRGRQKGIPGEDPCEDERKEVQHGSPVNSPFQSGTYHVPVTMLDTRYSWGKTHCVLTISRQEKYQKVERRLESISSETS